MFEQPRLNVSFWGIRTSGDGVFGIVAALSVVGMPILLYHF